MTFPAVCECLTPSVWGNYMTKPTKITVETNSLFLLQAQIAERAWCAQCTAESELVALDRIGVISNLNREELEEWLNAGGIHRVDTSDGASFICLTSLLAWIQQTTCGFPLSRAMCKEDQ